MGDLRCDNCNRIIHDPETASVGPYGAICRICHLNPGTDGKECPLAWAQRDADHCLCIREDCRWWMQGFRYTEDGKVIQGGCAVEVLARQANTSRSY